MRSVFLVAICFNAAPINSSASTCMPTSVYCRKHTDYEYLHQMTHTIHLMTSCFPVYRYSNLCAHVGHEQAHHGVFICLQWQQAAVQPRCSVLLFRDYNRWLLRVTVVCPEGD